MAQFVDVDFVDVDFVENDDEGPPFHIHFVGANGRLGVTIMGARGALDIPNLSLIIVSLMTLIQGWTGGA